MYDKTTKSVLSDISLGVLSGMFYLTIWIVLICFLIEPVRSANTGYCKLTNFTDPDPETCTCFGFDSLARLDFSICQTMYCNTIKLTPVREGEIVFDKQILSLLQYYSNTVTALRQIYLYDLAGIDLAILRDYNSSYVPLEMIFRQMDIFKFGRLNFNFYLDGRLLNLDKNSPTGIRCNESVLVDMLGTKTSIFNLNPLNIVFSDVRSSNVCPFVFQHFTIQSLWLEGSEFNFDTTDYSNLNDLNVSINICEVHDAYKLTLDESSLHPVVFGRSLMILKYKHVPFTK